MKSFVMTVGIVFALVVFAHIARLAVEPHLASNPWFWLTTIIAAALSAWAWRLLRIARKSGNSRLVP